MGITKIHVRIWSQIKTLWPSGLRRWLKAPFRKGVGSNLTGVIYAHWQLLASTEHDGHGRKHVGLANGPSALGTPGHHRH